MNCTLLSPSWYLPSYLLVLMFLFDVTNNLNMNSHYQIVNTYKTWSEMFQQLIQTRALGEIMDKLLPYLFLLSIFQNSCPLSWSWHCFWMCVTMKRCDKGKTAWKTGKHEKLAELKGFWNSRNQDEDIFLHFVSLFPAYLGLLFSQVGCTSTPLTCLFVSCHIHCGSALLFVSCNVLAVNYWKPLSACK